MSNQPELGIAELRAILEKDLRDDAVCVCHLRAEIRQRARDGRIVIGFQRRLQPRDELLPVVGVQFVPAAHAVYAVRDREQVALVAHVLHLLLEPSGLLKEHRRIFVAVDE